MFFLQLLTAFSGVFKKNKKHEFTFPSGPLDNNNKQLLHYIDFFCSTQEKQKSYNYLKVTDNKALSLIIWIVRCSHVITRKLMRSFFMALDKCISKMFTSIFC